MLKARDAFQYGRGEDQGIDALKTRFNDYCPEPKIPVDENPFFTCVQKSGLCPDVSLLQHNCRACQTKQDITVGSRNL